MVKVNVNFFIATSVLIPHAQSRDLVPWPVSHVLLLEDGQEMAEGFPSRGHSLQRPTVAIRNVQQESNLARCRVNPAAFMTLLILNKIQKHWPKVYKNAYKLEPITYHQTATYLCLHSCSSNHTRSQQAEHIAQYRVEAQSRFAEQMTVHLLSASPQIMVLPSSQPLAILLPPQGAQTWTSFP